MNTEKNTNKQKRDLFIQNAFEEVNKISDFSKLYIRVFCVLAKLGLQLDAKRENFFGNEYWGNPEYMEKLKLDTKDFLTRHIK